MSNLPDFEALAVFAKVAEERSFAGAARELAMSVPTVSRCVDRLERRLGARLFNRSSRRLALTEFGHTLVERARRLHLDAIDTEAGARELSATPRGLVRLAAPMSYGLRWLAPILPAFLDAYPEISIDLHLSDQAVDLIGEGYDAALRIAVLQDSTLAARRICRVSRFIVAAPAYLRKHGRPQHPRDLIETDCLAYSYRARTDAWEFVHRNGKSYSVTPRGRLRVTSADALIPLVLAGGSVAELPEFIAGEYLKDGRMERLLPDWHQHEGGLYFVTPTTRARPAKVDALLQFLIERLSAPAWAWNDTS